MRYSVRMKMRLEPRVFSNLFLFSRGFCIHNIDICTHRREYRMRTWINKQYTYSLFSLNNKQTLPNYLLHSVCASSFIILRNNNSVIANPFYSYFAFIYQKINFLLRIFITIYKYIRHCLGFFAAKWVWYNSTINL